jgi:hypothetical protein
MKFKDYFNLKLSEYAKSLKGDKTEADLEIALETQTLPDERVIEFESLEVDSEVFLIVEGEEPVLIMDETLTLEDGQMIVVDAEGKISEIKPKEEKEEEPAPMEAELSEEQKHVLAIALALDVKMLESLVNLKENGYYTVEFGVQDGQVKWADLYSNTYKTLLSKQVDPIKVELEAEKTKVTDLEAKVVLLQELNDEKNPLKNTVKLEDEKPVSYYKRAMGVE